MTKFEKAMLTAFVYLLISQHHNMSLGPLPPVAQIIFTVGIILTAALFISLPERSGDV